ncbi:tetratricopeptide repeat protein [Flectobacillus major]|jgi:tetratricopeptide (TPR) repeat protein|uniref:tetratricopeptide repeat protein n=1 Tax=Flectobacillus major TaxID=103 RepID=UPI0004194624|nr:tetratricopeptide repeat protein [Flectobacillus major]
MNNFRLQQLEIFYQEEPNDPFNIYALATEYLKSKPEKAQELFEKLLSEHPHYWATYYHAGALYAANGAIEKAHETYKKGIEVVTMLKNEKALKELKGAYQLFLDEQEDW